MSAIDETLMSLSQQLAKRYPSFQPRTNDQQANEIADHGSCHRNFTATHRNSDTNVILATEAMQEALERREHNSECGCASPGRQYARLCRRLWIELVSIAKTLSVPLITRASPIPQFNQRSGILQIVDPICELRLIGLGRHTSLPQCKVAEADTRRNRLMFRAADLFLV